MLLRKPIPDGCRFADRCPYSSFSSPCNGSSIFFCSLWEQKTRKEEKMLLSRFYPVGNRFPPVHAT
ncbi:MAG TPA: hypothetical protein VLV31_00005 [Candidatus Acidoferrales bacterium]|nr:hypothetical protein [Candidatus Acidoferrales bacterium]